MYCLLLAPKVCHGMKLSRFLVFAGVVKAILYRATDRVQEKTSIVLEKVDCVGNCVVLHSLQL